MCSTTAFPLGEMLDKLPGWDLLALQSSFVPDRKIRSHPNISVLPVDWLTEHTDDSELTKVIIITMQVNKLYFGLLHNHIPVILQPARTATAARSLQTSTGSQGKARHGTHRANSFYFFAWANILFFWFLNTIKSNLNSSSIIRGSESSVRTLSWPVCFILSQSFKSGVHPTSKVHVGTAYNSASQ